MDYVSILRSALNAPYSTARATGCGRVYVAISKEHRRGIAAAAKKLGARYWGKESQCPYALYVGYDNGTGIELGKGTAIADALKAAGVSCYRDEYDD